MKKNITCGICLSALMMSSVAFAENTIALPGEFSANVAAVSQYSFRGIAQSDENPAIQGGFDWSHDSGFYLGVWGSNVDFNDGDQANLETDLYGGYEFNAAGLDFGVGAIYYAYPGANANLDYDFYEVNASVGKDFGWTALSASINYSPDYFGGSDKATYYSISAEAPLTMVPGEFVLSGSFGHQDITKEATFGVPDYNDWTVGISTNLNGFDLGLTYKDTDLNQSECADGCDAAGIFSISKSFN